MDNLIFLDELKKINIDLNDYQQQQLEIFFKNLIETNKQFNLTAITERSEVNLKHFFDSLTVNSEIPANAKIIDIGAGAGFPSIPLKIASPDVQITMVDSLDKRVKFLQSQIEQLYLKDTSAIHSRAEDLGQDKQFRNFFDVALARAVASTNVLVEYLLPLIHINGKVILMKGDWSKAIDELETAKNAIKILGGEIEDIKQITLPNGDQRSIVVIKKNADTPNKYPRKAGVPAKNPL